MTQTAAAQTEDNNNEKETDMNEAKKTAARKPAAAKKATARKPKATTGRKRTAGVKRTRKARTVHPMTADLRALAASVVANSVELALASESLGVKRSNVGELPGARQGTKSRIVLEDGTVITVSVVVR